MNVYNRALKSRIEVMRDQQSEGFVEDFKIADGTFKNLNKEKRLVLSLSEQNEKFKIVIATSFVPVILIFRRTLWWNYIVFYLSIWKETENNVIIMETRRLAAVFKMLK